MGKNGKRFIDKRRDVLHTFKVVPRSQQDPLVADETAPQAVLHPQDQGEKKEERVSYGVFFDDDYDYLQHLRGVREAINWDQQELEVYTIRRQDPQTGKKQLRGKKLVLPSSAFESYVEEPIGLLNKAAPISGPQPELDPDVVAGLDDDVIGDEHGACHPDDDGALPDDFVLMLNAEQPIHDFDGESDGEWDDDDDDDGSCEEGDDNKDMQTLVKSYIDGLLPPSKLSMYRDQLGHEGECEGRENQEEQDFSSDFNDSEAEDDLVSLKDNYRQTLSSPTPESHFTNYSMSSSVLPRNKGLSTLDDCFEEKFLREYQEEQVGALDGEEVEGWVGEESAVFQQAMERSRKQLASAAAAAAAGAGGGGGDTVDERGRIIRWIHDMQNHRAQHPTINEDKEEVEVSDDGEEKWDCESILTTASTLYNHPRTITDPPRRKRIAVDPNTGIPLEYRVAGLTRRNLAQHDDAPTSQDKDDILDTQTLITSMSAISVRPPGETSEERRFRKNALKELRRERRIEKKLNRTAFKDEKKRQEKILQNNKYNYKISLI